MEAISTDLIPHRPTLNQLEVYLDRKRKEDISLCGGYSQAIEEHIIGSIAPRRSCGAAYTECAIGPMGGLFPCRALMASEFRAGSLLNEELTELWRRSHIFNLLREFDPKSIDECRDCPFIRLCHGGCRGFAFNSSGKWNGWIGKYRCHLSMNEILHRLIGHHMAYAE
jgi:radical SAM protein with 4Fe4S-binding SPASM domain